VPSDPPGDEGTERMTSTMVPKRTLSVDEIDLSGLQLTAGFSVRF